MESDKMETECDKRETECDKRETECDKMETECDKMETEEMMDKTYNKKMSEEQKYDWQEAIEPHIKIAVIGEKGCGKSSLILAAKNQIFPHPEEQFVSKQYPLDVEIDGKIETCMVAEADAGDDNIDRRIKVYSETNVVLLCFDEIKRLADVKKKWGRELDDQIPDVPAILVRVKKTKLEKDVSSHPTELGKFSGILECCPHARECVQEVFQEAVKKARK